MILGDPGSGKTTQLKRLLLFCLRQGSGELGLPEDLLPVFLPLRDLPNTARGLDAFIEASLSSPHWPWANGFSKRLLERGRLLLLFDGLDEVSDPQQRAQVAGWIDAALKVLPDCYAVVSCRFAGYGVKVRLGAQFLELHLRPLTREQAETFIRRWYRAVETYVATELLLGESLATQRADTLIERLRQPDFRCARMTEMTRNPLLLTNLCLVHRDRGALPRNRHQLYDECTDVLLERWSAGAPAKNWRSTFPPNWVGARCNRWRCGCTKRKAAPAPRLRNSPLYCSRYCKVPVGGTAMPWRFSMRCAVTAACSPAGEPISSALCTWGFRNT